MIYAMTVQTKANTSSKSFYRANASIVLGVPDLNSQRNVACSDKISVPFLDSSCRTIGII